MKPSPIIEDHSRAIQIKPDFMELSLGGNNNYPDYLRAQNIPYSYESPYLVAGHPDEKEAWLIHISVVRRQFDALIRPLLEFLKNEKFPFAIPADADQHSRILDGRSGFALTGKAITIYVSHFCHT